MKNLLKVAALASVMSISMAACGGHKSDNVGDTVNADSAKADSTKVVTDTIKNDTTIKNDSTKKDTSIKVVTKTTETKKK